MEYCIRDLKRKRANSIEDHDESEIRKMRISMDFPPALRRLNALYSSQESIVDFEDPPTHTQLRKDDFPFNFRSREMNPDKTSVCIGSESWESISQYTQANGVVLQKLSDVELQSGNFFRIKKILRCSRTRQVFFQGLYFRKIQQLRLLLEGSENDLVWDIEKTEQVAGKGLVVISPSAVRRSTRIIVTNTLRTEANADAYFCKWKLTTMSENNRKLKEISLQRIAEFEADKECRVSDQALKMEWQEDTIPVEHLQDGTYSALDSFCCSGGWSMGARLAGGITVVRAFDQDEKACEAYRWNHQDVNVFNESAFDYIHNASNIVIDILHLSPPCKTFSIAHTRPGKNDDTNYAASFAALDLVKKHRPRIITYENTFGLESRHGEDMKRIFAQLTGLGYSIRWSVKNLADYGLPQIRKRLLMFASW
jgi:hypothetical protein